MEKTFADLYDEMMIYVDYDSWSKLIDNRLKELVMAKELLEIGCGTGEISKRLDDLNYSVKGIDISDSMLRRAKDKYNYLKFEKTDMRDLKEKNSYDAIISVFDTINYLKNLDELRVVFYNVKNALKEKGVFLFDVLNRKMIENMFSDGIFSDDRENISIMWKHSYQAEKGLDVINTSFFVRGDENNYKRYDKTFQKKIFSNKEILGLAEEAGFQLISREVNTEIAGPRMIYIFQRGD